MARATIVRGTKRTDKGGATPKRKAAPKGCPLWLHKASGQWCRKVRGRFAYFGTDLTAALDQWAAEGPALLAGKPRPNDAARLTVADAANEFLTAKASRVSSGELSRGSLSEYIRDLEVLVHIVGRETPIAELGPAEFEALRPKLAKGVGPVTLGGRIQSVRALCKWLWESEMLDRPMRFGPGFSKPSAATLRKSRAAKVSREYSAEEVLTLLAAAERGSYIRAVILMAVSNGFGNSDCAALDRGHIEGEWIALARPKTGIARRGWLWPEVVEAIREHTLMRPDPTDDNDSDAVFLTRRGFRLVRSVPRLAKPLLGSNHDAVRSAFERVAQLVGVSVAQRGFYGLRSTFRTVADALPDTPAIDLVMGHTPSSRDVRKHYVRRIDDARLRAVGEHVRAWLFRPGSSGLREAGRTAAAWDGSRVLPGRGARQ